ncbi:MAG: DNA primase [Cycloclasticus sp. symbiont of Poecilosclerida sp. M]|nr:MAG: DNA primase [Cycloclasticus sp. symbiont of Poecilosclerida sp. M]
MAGRIPQNFIDDLLARTDVVDVIDGLVPLKKKGANYSACCPFHNEKTPSFTVSQDKQFYHCFGCGANGSAIGFLMDFSHLEFVEAIEELASRAGVEVVRENDGGTYQPKVGFPPLYELNEKVSAFFQQQLREHSAATAAVNYLKQRGISGRVAKNFQLGFAPPGWSAVLSQFGEDEAQKKQLLELGLIVTNENDKTYDRFRDRIIFPIRNKRGAVIGFGGRVLGDDSPKYLNSPETPLYHKGREVYGLYEASQASSKLQCFVLVEGYLDVIALHESGLPYAVAALGTAITREQVDLLFRTASEIVICMDGDSAGQKASWRAVVNALPALKSGRQIKILLLPTGEDPDSLVRGEGKEKFEQRIEEATPLSEYFFDTLAKEHPLSALEGRASFLEQAKPLVDLIPKSAFSQMMKKQLATLAQVDSVGAVSRRPRVRANTGKKQPSSIRQLITLLLHNPGFASKIDSEETWLDMEQPGMSVLCQILEIAQGSPELSAAMLLERFRGQENEKTIALLFAEEVLISDEMSEAEFDGSVSRLREQYKGNKLEVLLEKSRSQNLSESEQEELRQLIKQ